MNPLRCGAKTGRMLATGDNMTIASIRLAGIGLAALMAACGPSSDPVDATAAAIVHDGAARFTVVTPTLLRLEYAEDGRFEDGPTQTVPARKLPRANFSSAIENGERIIRTSALTLRYRRGSGPFGPDNLSISLRNGDTLATARPDWSGVSANNLGGWRRGLDNDQDPQPLHDGLLSRDGWYLLDDSATVLLTDTPPGFAARPARSGAYQDGYFFGYGQDYALGLADLRTLTGAAPLLPRKALGVWFSRYWAYSESELRELVGQFQAHGVPLDTLSMDTDWKRMHNALGCVAFSLVAGARPDDPCSWNGWSWNTDLYPDPPAFLAWAKSQGLEIGLNVHPSISSRDPAFATTEATAGGLSIDTAVPPCTLFQADPLAQCYVFDLTQPAQIDAYFDLHAGVEDGIDFWWFDWCCDGTHAIAPGLTADTWINRLYALDNARRGSRWPAFSRIGASFQEGKAGVGNKGAGAFAEHRYTMHFTGDTCATWPMLAFEAQMTASEGNIGLPYVSHDIGSFLGEPTATGCNGTLGRTPHLPDDLYVRWLQFGTFQPILRLHSHHGDRLPWEYPGDAERIAIDFLRLRERLIPYLYTLAREAHDTGLPMTRALYLSWPDQEGAYAHPGSYLLGRDMLVATVAAPGDPAEVDVWIPPGTWTDYFTGESFTGPATITRSVPLDRYPLFMRAGAILPTQPDLPTTPAGPQDDLTLSVWPGGDGRFDLYDDEGRGFGYRDGAFARTLVRTSTSAQGCVTVAIEPVRGSFPGALPTRRWTLRVVGVDLPAVVVLDGAPLAAAADASDWSYSAAERTLTVTTGARPTAALRTLVAGPADCGAT